MPQRRVPIRYRVRPGACGSILCKLEGGNPDVLRKQKYRMEWKSRCGLGASKMRPHSLERVV
jgi:hypothetical protein